MFSKMGGDGEWHVNKSKSGTEDSNHIYLLYAEIQNCILVE